MCPPALNHPADIALNGSDEKVIMYLDNFKPGTPLPRNVLEDINPYQFSPSNLPEGIWYIIDPTERKENEFGFWQVKEEAFEIFTSSSISGWRTTLEFFEFADFLERRTDWVMQEYRITEKGQCDTNKYKEQRAICRIFLSAARSFNKEMHPESKASVIDGTSQTQTVPSIAKSIDNISRKGSTSESLMKTLVDGRTLLSEVDKVLDPQLQELLPYAFDGDFLELDDLVDPASSSSSSDNSGRSSMKFDEYFDPDAILQELEDNSNQGQQEKDSSSKCTATAPIRAFEVVMQPATLGSLVSASETWQPSGRKPAPSGMETKFLDNEVTNHTVKRSKAERRDEGPSTSHDVAASSGTSTATPNKSKKAALPPKRGQKKLNVCKYFCFMPF